MFSNLFETVAAGEMQARSDGAAEPEPDLAATGPR